MARKATTKTARTRPSRGKLTDSQKDELARLGQLGGAVTPADCAKILGCSEEVLTSYLKSPLGRKLWSTARAEGRKELATRIRADALSGNPQAQKILADLLTADDTRPLAEQQITQKELAVLVGRSTTQIRKHQHDGQMVKPDGENRYRLGDVFRVVATLWDENGKLKATVHNLEQMAGETMKDRAEADRLLKLEQVRRRKRENDAAEGRLVDADEVRSRVDRLCEVVREQANVFVGDLLLKLSADDETEKRVQEMKRRFLAACAAEMEKGDES